MILSIRTVFSICLALSCLVIFSSASAGVYKHVDSNGKVSFSDKPISAEQGELSEKVELKKTNAASAIKPLPPRKTAITEESTSYQVRITSPANNATFSAAVGNITISANISPEQPKGHTLVATVNGQRTSNQSAQGSSVVLNNVNPGQQQLQLQLLNAAGVVVATSQSVTVNVIRRRAR